MKYSLVFYKDGNSKDASCSGGDVGGADRITAGNGLNHLGEGKHIMIYSFK